MLNIIKNFFKKYWVIVTVILLFVIIRMVTLQHHAVIEWDAAVYIGMGKYLFSHGTVGAWEVLRPLGLPFILGLAWKIGLNPYTFGTIFSILVSAGMLALVYFFAEEVRKGSGTIAALLLASSTIFFRYSSVPITDITSAFFALLSLFLVYKATTNKQYFLSGLFAAIAFMFRFPQGLLLIVGAVSIIAKIFQQSGKKKWNDRIAATIEQLFIFGGGFMAIVIPFLVVNYYIYGNAFVPFIEATINIGQYPSLYNKGVLFYFIELLKQDPFFILALVPMALCWKKKYRHAGVIALTAAVVVVGGYFFYQQHKELRFVLAFLPYIAILSGVGVVYILEYFKLPQLLFFGIFFIAAFMVYAPALLHSNASADDPILYAFNTYLVTAPKARILSSTPYTFAYTDVLLIHNLYIDWNDAYAKYNLFRQDNDYIALDSCSLELGCADYHDCKADKQALLTELAAKDREVFSQTTPSQCVLSIYKINH